MKTSIMFRSAPIPALLVDGQEVASVQQIDLDLRDDGTIAIDRIHCRERHQMKMPGLAPGQPPVLMPWEQDKPTCPVHPGVRVQRSP